MKKRSGRPPRFAQVPNEAVDDALSLDLTSLGLLTVFLRHKDGYDITLAKIGAKYGYGEDAMANAMGLLQVARYVVKVRVMGAGNKWRTEMAVYAPPARDCEVEELLASIREEDPNARRVEVIPPTPSAIKRAQKRRVKLGQLSDAPTPGNPGVGGDTREQASSQVVPDSGVSRDPENPRVSKKTACKKTKEEDKTAPSARSAADARRASAGSSAREAGSGFAATEKTGSAAEDGKPGQVPQQRGKGRKGSPFPPELRERIYATEELLPPLLRGLLREMFPYGHLPNENRKVIAQALEFRTPEQLGERAARRWISLGYDRDFHDGGIRKPLGVVEELLRRTPYCPDPECEDQTNFGTGEPCVPCTERRARRARDYRVGRPVATHRPPRLYLHREECNVCQRPLPAEVPEDPLCGQCRTEMARGTAFLLGAPDDHETDQDDHPDAAYAPAPPNAEYRQQRERQAAAKGAPF
ncbi:hypothetical protein [Streptomyces werraensis]|uniref:hypothetical protein n=1 Tax=Streptomyces werraensis TaxID=68284 RepID=UPI0037CDB175